MCWANKWTKKWMKVLSIQLEITNFISMIIVLFIWWAEGFRLIVLWYQLSFALLCFAWTVQFLESWAVGIIGCVIPATCQWLSEWLLISVYWWTYLFIRSSVISAVTRTAGVVFISEAKLIVLGCFADTVIDRDLPFRGPYEKSAADCVAHCKSKVCDMHRCLVIEREYVCGYRNTNAV